MRMYKFFALVLLCTVSLALAEEIVSLPSQETSVTVRNQKNIRSFLRIPSPGFCYDNLKFTARVQTGQRDTIFQVSMLAPTNQPDLVIMPYARILRPDYTEIASDSFTNCILWTNGQILAKRYQFPEKITKYLIAVGYVNYQDTRYRHISGGPYETVIDQDGKIVHRGKPLTKSKYSAKWSIDSNVIFLDDEIEVKLAQEVVEKSGTNEVETVFDYIVCNLDTGKIIADKSGVTKPVIKMKTTGNYGIDVSIFRNGKVFWHDMKLYTVLPRLEKTFDPDYLGKLTLNDGIVCGSSNDVHQFQDGRYSPSVKDRITQRYYASEITNIFGGRGRVITQDRGYFSYNLGVNIKYNMPYLLEIEYPEDAPRTFAISVNGETYSPCVQTGHTMAYQTPDRFVEQLELPLNQGVNKMQFIIWAGDNEVRNGFNVGIADPGNKNAPFSRKPLALRVSLYSFLTLAVPQQKEQFPLQYQRYVWTESEDMVAPDGVFFAQVLNSYFFGMNAFSPLALSYNSHAENNGTIMYPTEHYKTPLRTEINGHEYKSNYSEESGLRENRIGLLADLARYTKLKIFPRFEYGGSDLLSGCEAIKEDGSKYDPFLYDLDNRPIADSVDVTYDKVTEDFIAVINEMFNYVSPKALPLFRNLIFRQRANFTVVSYSDHALAKYAAEKGLNLQGEALRHEVTVNRGEDYKAWYQVQKLNFLEKVNAAYNQKLKSNFPLLYYNWREGGMPYEGLYFHTKQEWDKIKATRFLPVEGFPLPKLSGEDLVAAVTRWAGDEEGLPKTFSSKDTITPVCPVYGTLSDSYAPYHNLFRKSPDSLEFSVKVVPGVKSQTLVLDAQKKPSLAGQTMYRSREYSMYDPLMAFIYSNPRNIIFEQSHQTCFAFAPVARRFFMNYLALPLVQFGKVPQAEGVPVSVFIGICENQPYIALANETMYPVSARVSLPLTGVKNLRPLVTKSKRQDFFLKDDAIEFDVVLAPLELRSFKAE